MIRLKRISIDLATHAKNYHALPAFVQFLHMESVYTNTRTMFRLHDFKFNAKIFDKVIFLTS